MLMCLCFEQQLQVAGSRGSQVSIVGGLLHEVRPPEPHHRVCDPAQHILQQQRRGLVYLFPLLPCAIAAGAYGRATAVRSLSWRWCGFCHISCIRTMRSVVTRSRYGHAHLGVDVEVAPVALDVEQRVAAALVGAPRVREPAVRQRGIPPEQRPRRLVVLQRRRRAADAAADVTRRRRRLCRSRVSGFSAQQATSHHMADATAVLMRHCCHALALLQV